MKDSARPLRARAHAPCPQQISSQPQWRLAVPYAGAPICLAPDVAPPAGSQRPTHNTSCAEEGSHTSDKFQVAYRGGQMSHVCGFMQHSVRHRCHLVTMQQSGSAHDSMLMSKFQKRVGQCLALPSGQLLQHGAKKRSPSPVGSPIHFQLHPQPRPQPLLLWKVPPARHSARINCYRPKQHQTTLKTDEMPGDARRWHHVGARLFLQSRLP